MKAKVKRGEHLLFMEGVSNNWDNLKDKMIINFKNKYFYRKFHQTKNRLIITLIPDGELDFIEIVFTGETPVLEFDSWNKDQLILSIKQ